MRKLLTVLMLIPALVYGVDNAKIGNLEARGGSFSDNSTVNGNFTVTNGDIIVNGQSITNVIKTAQSSNALYAAVSGVSTTSTYAGTANVSTTATYAATANNASNLTQYTEAFSNAVKAIQATNLAIYATNTSVTITQTGTGVVIAANGGSGTPGAGTITTNMMTGAAHDLYGPQQAFLAYLTTTQTTAVATRTLVTNNAVLFDTHNAFDTATGLYNFGNNTGIWHVGYSTYVLNNVNDPYDAHLRIYTNGVLRVTQSYVAYSSTWTDSANNTYIANAIYLNVDNTNTTMALFVGPGAGSLRVHGQDWVAGQVDIGTTYMYGRKIPR